MRRFRAFFLLVSVVVAVGCAAEPDVVQRSVMLADKGRYPEAVKALDAHLHTHPHDVAARRLLVRMLGFEGNLGRAREEAARLGAELGPQSPVPWLELGYALELAHRYDEALECYDQAALAAPTDAAGPRTGGLRAARWGEHDVARPRLEEALRRDPRDAHVWHALGLVCLGQGDLEAAEHAYRSGLLADPRALENRIGLATVALVRKDPAAALREYDAILADRPKHADAALGRAWALYELGRLDEAASALAEAVKLGASPAIVKAQTHALAERRAALGRSNVDPSSTAAPAR